MSGFIIDEKKPRIKIKLLRSGVELPRKATDGSAGYDLSASIDNPVTIEPGQIEKINTGIAIALPSSRYAALIYARSGLAVKHGLAPANCVGVIDSDYRGEIIVGLLNSSKQSYTVTPGERIAQMVITELPQTELCPCDELDDTDRSSGGFGSTGKI